MRALVRARVGAFWSNAYALHESSDSERKNDYDTQPPRTRRWPRPTREDAGTAAFLVAVLFAAAALSLYEFTRCHDARGVLTLYNAHKSGHVASDELHRRHWRCTTRKPDPKDDTPLSAPSLVVVRNAFEMAASGYAYHKLGAECYLDENFGPANFHHKNFWNNASWWASLNVTAKRAQPYRNRPTICEALQVAPEETGLEMYAEAVFYNDYRAFDRFLQRNRNGERVCLANLSAWEAAYFGPSSSPRRRLTMAHSSHEGHAQRARHRAHIVAFDRREFGGRYAALQRKMGCPP